jgi:hypothetical protein
LGKINDIAQNQNQALMAQMFMLNMLSEENKKQPPAKSEASPHPAMGPRTADIIYGP